MGTRKSKRELSTRHFSDDFAWDSLPQFTQDLRSVFPSPSPPTRKSAPSTSQHPQHGDQQYFSPDSNKGSLPQAPSMPISSASLPGSPDDLSKLRLHMETQELEIKRLLLELQLAQIKHRPRKMARLEINLKSLSEINELLSGSSIYKSGRTFSLQVSQNYSLS